MDSISQKIKGGARSICPACIHYDVCKAVNNQPCIECTKYMPAADVAPVVRCKDCSSQYDWPWCGMFPGDGFCSAGIKKMDGES